MPAAAITDTGARREEGGIGTITRTDDMKNVEIIAGQIGPQGWLEGVGAVASWSNRSFFTQRQCQGLR